MRRLAAAAVALIAVASPSLASARAGFRLGVAAGDVTARSAIVWTRAPHAGLLTVVLYDVTKGARVVVPVVPFPRVVAARAHDLTVRFAFHGLTPAHQYRYAFVQGAVASGYGRFETAPAAASAARVRFAVSGDADAQPAPGSTRPFYNDFGVYGRMASEGNEFNVNLGDTIYSDSEVPGAGKRALTVRAKWAKYRQNLALPKLQVLRRLSSLYSEWDDHEFVNDFSVPENGASLYRAGRAAFLDYAPVRATARLGLYRSVRWGRNLELFFLDERSFRSAKVASACPNGAGPDLAPTVPQPIRSIFAAFGLSSLATPVPQSCLDAIASPARTFLGARQYAAFTHAVQASTATFKVVLTETPIQQFYALPYDRWEGYAAERTRLLTFPRLRNVVFLAADTHANLVNDVRLQTLEPGGRVPTGITEVVTGPAATMTFAREIDGTLGQPGAAAALARQFFSNPTLIGMRCAAIDTYAYAEVSVSHAALTVALKDIHGRPVVDGASGVPCPKVVVAAAPSAARG